MRERVMDVGLALLAALAVLLVIVAVNRAGDEPPRAEPDGTTGSPVGPRSAESADAGVSEGETPDETGADDATARVADHRAGLLVHAGVSDCDPGRSARVVVQADAGTRRTLVDGLHSVTAVQAVDGERARVVGGGADCEPVAFNTSDGGETWQPDRAAFGFWGLRPGDPLGVAAGNGEGALDVPCTPVGVSGVDPGVARVLCDDGRIVGTASAGVEWVTLGDLEAGSGIAYVTAAHAYGVSETDDCAGVLLRETHDGGADWQDVRCIEGDGPWAVAAVDSSVAVVGDGWQALSTDGGESWTRG